MTAGVSSWNAWKQGTILLGREFSASIPQTDYRANGTSASSHQSTSSQVPHIIWFAQAHQTEILWLIWTLELASHHNPTTITTHLYLHVPAKGKSRFSNKAAEWCCELSLKKCPSDPTWPFQELMESGGRASLCQILMWRLTFMFLFACFTKDNPV